MEDENTIFDSIGVGEAQEPEVPHDAEQIYKVVIENLRLKSVLDRINLICQMTNPGDSYLDKVLLIQRLSKESLSRK